MISSLTAEAVRDFFVDYRLLPGENEGIVSKRRKL